MVSMWQGWTTAWPQVHLTRTLKVLLTGVHAKVTTLSVEAALASLPAVALSAAQVAAQLIGDPALFTLAGPRGPAETQHLKTTPHGARVAAEFRASEESLTRFWFAQRTVLRCCAARPATEFLDPASILDDPLSWVYGTQLEAGELRKAAAALSAAGLLFTVGQHPVLQLSAVGQLCVERYNSDPRQMPKHT